MTEPKIALGFLKTLIVNTERIFRTNMQSNGRMILKYSPLKMKGIIERSSPAISIAKGSSNQKIVGSPSIHNLIATHDTQYPHYQITFGKSGITTLDGDSQPGQGLNKIISPKLSGRT